MEAFGVFETRLLYIAVFVVSSFMAFLSQSSRKASGEYCEFRVFPFVLSFLLPWYVICFTNIGSDYANYSFIIDRLSWDNFSSFYDEEPWMNFLFLLIRTTARDNTDVTIFVIKSLNIFLVYFSFWILRRKVRIWQCVFSYLLLLYLPSFYLITIAFAVGVCFFGLSLYFLKGTIIPCLMIILFAAQFHNSAYLYLFSFIAFLLVGIKGISSLSKVLVTITYLFLVLFSAKVYSAAQMISGFHYNNYGTNSFSGSGFMVPVIYVPLFLFVYLMFQKNFNKKLVNAAYVFALSSILFNILSYNFRVIERMEFYYSMLFCLIIPLFLFESEMDVVCRGSKRCTSLIGFLLFLYVLFRGYMVFMDRTTSVSGVGHYLVFNPFS